MGVAEVSDRSFKMIRFLTHWSRRGIWRITRSLQPVRISSRLFLDGLSVWGITARKGAPDKVLIVRLDAIGDFFLWIDSAKELRRIYPSATLVLAANALWADVADRLGLWDEVIPVSIPAFARVSRYRYAILRLVRRNGFFSVSIQPTISRFLLLGDAIVRASAASERIGAAGDSINMSAAEQRHAAVGYTRLLTSESLSSMELERNVAFINQLSGEKRVASVASVPVLGKLNRALIIDGPYFVLFPGASVALRQWPVEYFAEVADEIVRSHGWKVVMCGAPSEIGLCASLSRKLGHPSFDLCGKTELWELVEVIRNACFLIGNETSAIHIAAAVGTPSVCVLGGGHYGRFMPYPPSTIARGAPVPAVHPMKCFNCNWHCSQPHEIGQPVPCIANITPVMAKAAVKLALVHQPKVQAILH